MISSYIEDSHCKWDMHLPEFRFALNSAIHETTGASPADLHLGRKLQSPLKRLLKGKNLSPDSSGYDLVHHIRNLQKKAHSSANKAKLRQLRTYNKNRRDVAFLPKDRVWGQNHPQSFKHKHFSAKLAPKWRGPTLVMQPYCGYGRKTFPFSFTKHINQCAWGKMHKYSHPGCGVKRCLQPAGNSTRQCKPERSEVNAWKQRTLRGGVVFSLEASLPRRVQWWESQFSSLCPSSDQRCSFNW